MKSAFVTLVVFAMLGGHSSEGYAADLEKQEKAIKIIREAARDLCESSPIEGGGETLELSGEGKAKVNGIVSKVVDLGFQGAAKYKKDAYNGVLQGDLAETINSGNQCRLKVFESLKDKLIPEQSSSVGPGPTPQAVALPKAVPPKLPTGFVTNGCGCWGPVVFGQTAPNVYCASGGHVALGCPAYCPTGGYQWRTECL